MMQTCLNQGISRVFHAKGINRAYFAGVKQINDDRGIKQKVRMVVLSVSLMFLSAFALHAQKEIHGNVTDINGDPIPGVNIIVKGTGHGTITDIDGNFLLSVPEDNQVLVFSFIGYLKEEMDVSTMSSVTVTLLEDITNLDEVVVIGYGTQKRSDLTGAVSSVSSDDMEKTNTSSLLGALQGKAAGVQLVPSTGMPNSETLIRIRGISSISEISGDNASRQKVLWIVDGIPSDPNSVNPSDIESMEILKDASSTAIYGANGSNGVVLITTKQGRPGKVSANIKVYGGYSKLPNTVDVLNAEKFARMANELNIIQNSRNGLVDRPNVPDVYDSTDIAWYSNDANSYNYQELLFKKAPAFNVDFSVSGGTEKVTSYFSMSYSTQDGILKNQSYERMLGVLKIDYNLNDYVSFGTKIDAKLEKTSGVPEWRFFDEYNSPITGAISFAPIQRPYIEGAHPDSMWSTNPISNITNPFLVVDTEDQYSKNNNTNGIAYVKITPVKGLVMESRFKANLSNDRYRKVIHKYYYDAANKSSNYGLDKNYGEGYGYLFQNIITYSNSVRDIINLSAMGGYEVGAGYYTQLQMGANAFRAINEESLYYGFNVLPGSDLRYTESATEEKGYSYFGRLSMDYRNMILVQGNIRQDASSLFGPKYRKGLFPGVSVGFKFTELDVFKNIEWLSFGKLRYGYGQSGNNPIKPYTYYSQVAGGTNFANAQYSFDNSTATDGAFPINLANTAIHWEAVVTSNLGLDANFFNNKLTFTFELFTRVNNEMIIKPTLPGFAGWAVTDAYFENNDINSEPYANIGQISSKGWETVIGYKNRNGKLKYDISANVTYVKNTADKLNEVIYYRGNASRPNGSFTRTQEGGGIGEFYGYKIVKMFKADDVDTLTRNVSTNINKPRWGTIVKATNQPIKEVISSFVAVNVRGDSIFKTISGLDTIYVQNNASAGDFQFFDANGDGVLNEDDYQPLGNPFAPYIFGLNINLEYGWFDLNMMWQGNYGNKIFNARKAWLSNADGQSNWSGDYYNNYYRDDIYDYDGNLVLEARDGSEPRLDPLNLNQNLASPSEYFIEDGSYIKLRSVQLGISIPNKYLQLLGLYELRVFAGGRNLLTFTKYTGMDPEVELRDPLVAGIDKGGYPIPKSYSAGIQVKF